MSTQNYGNHIRYYTAHHFVFYPIIGLFFLFSLYQSFSNDSNQLLWLMIAALFLAIALLSYMLRQHYALGNQNRIVRLEMRFRYYVLTQQRFEPIESRLSLSQVFALRFASDEELPALAERALKENLSADEIKRSIKNWLPDEMRL